MILAPYHHAIENALEAKEFHGKNQLIPILADRFLVLIENIFEEIRRVNKIGHTALTTARVLTDSNCDTLGKMCVNLFNIHVCYTQYEETGTDSIFNIKWKEHSYTTHIHLVWLTDNRFVTSSESIRHMISTVPLAMPPSYNVETHNEDFFQAAKEKEGTDVILEVENQKFHAHRFMLKRKAPDYFVPLLERFKEAKSEVVEIKEVPKETFEEVLRFIYTGQTKPTPEVNAILNLFEQADLFQIDGLKQLANARLANWLNEHPLNFETFEDVFKIGYLYDNKFALNACLVFAEKSDKHLEFFLNLVTKENYSSVAKYLTSSYSEKVRAELLKKSIEFLKK